jgi:peptidoglycan glycosyltransferase
MLEYAEKYGFTERIKVGELLTARGNFDSAASGSVNLAWSGVGQFTNTVCPAAMLRFVGAIANEGRAVNLQLLKRTGISALIPAGSTRLMNRNTAKELSEIIEIQNRENFPGLSIHAKSGTAQVGNNKDPHAWYVGYITNKDYPLAFVVMVENGGGGTAVAAPIANRVLQLAIK